MILQIILLLVGFVLLIKGADFFVDGSSSVALNLKVSKMLIGLTIIAFGTSAPEFAVSLQSIASGANDMLLGNVIGSNIMNILLILGVAAVIRPIKVQSSTVRKEIPMLIMITALLAVLILDVPLANATENLITRNDALAIILFFGVFIYYLIAMAINRKNEKTNDDAKQMKMWKSIILVALGLAGIIFGSNMVVNSATEIATEIGISQRIIALTVIAFGTSLPELVTTIVASVRGEQDLLVGNIIGSNIFNVCMVLGIPVAIFGGISTGSFSTLDLIAFIVSACVLFVVCFKKHHITRIEGGLMLAAFAGYYTTILLTQ